MERERAKLKTAFQGIRNELDGIPTEEHIEQVISFDHHPAPLGMPEIRTLGVCNDLSFPCGFVSHQTPGPGPATLDILVNGMSILGAPFPVGLLPPGAPIQIPFLPGSTAIAGVKLDYILDDMGAPLFHANVNVQWIKQV